MDSVRPHQFEPLWSVQNPSAPSTMQAALEITDLPNAARYVLAVSKPCLLWSSILPAIFRCSDQVMSAAYRIGDGSHARGIHIRSSPCNVDEPLFTGESTIVDSLKRPLYHQGIVVFSQRVNVLVGPSGPSSATCTTSREPSSTDSVPAYAARPSRYASPVTLSRFRTSPRYQGRPTAADMASCIAACSQGWSESDIAAALSREYLSRDMSRTRQAAYIRRTLYKARRWAAEPPRQSPRPRAARVVYPPSHSSLCSKGQHSSKCGRQKTFRGCYETRTPPLRSARIADEKTIYRDQACRAVWRHAQSTDFLGLSGVFA